MKNSFKADHSYLPMVIFTLDLVKIWRYSDESVVPALLMV